VSEEVGVASNEDDIELDFENDVSVDVKTSAKTSSAEHDISDEVTDRTHLHADTKVDFQDTSTVKLNPDSNDQQDQKVNVGVADEAECKSDELLSQTCSDGQAGDISLPMTTSVPGKAVAAGSMLVVDSVSDPQDSVNVQSEPTSSPGIGSSAAPVVDDCTTDRKSVLSQPSKKAGNKSVSMSMCVCMYVCS